MMHPILPLLFVLLLILLIGWLGGSIARNGGRSFWMGFVIALIGNFVGLLLMVYINQSPKKREFNPDFHRHDNEKIPAIKTLARLNEKGKVSDQQFEKLKDQILDQ